MTEKISIDIDEIMKRIPHRYPFLLIDKVEDITPCQRAIGIKNLTINELFFQGHFPHKPIMPGVLVIEAMAQTAAICNSFDENLKSNTVLFMSIEKAKFRKPVRPGDILKLDVQKARARGKVSTFSCKAYINDGILVSEATITAMHANSSE